MVFHIQYTSKSSESVQPQNGLHYMPCSINSNGPANVAQYFKPSVDDKKYYHASFRGRPLHGKEVPVPEGFVGLVLQEQKQPQEENVDRNMYVSRTFDGLTYWNYDALPTSNDALIKALDWIDIAQALHAPDDK